MPTATFIAMNDEEDPFLVTSKLEIQAILRSIEKKRAMLRMHVQGRTVAIITTILEIDPASRTLFVDNSTDEDFNRRIASANTVSFETNLDKVKIQFSVPQVTSCMQDNLPALQLAFPESIRRVQRRDYYRIDVPLTEPASCTITLPAIPNVQKITLNIKDISAGGISIFDNTHALDNSLGTIYQDCRLELPEAGTVVTNLRIMRSQDEQLNNGRQTRLLGCQFLALPNPMSSIIQQYIDKLERKLNAKRRGFD